MLRAGGGTLPPPAPTPLLGPTTLQILAMPLQIPLSQTFSFLVSRPSLAQAVNCLQYAVFDQYYKLGAGKVWDEAKPLHQACILCTKLEAIHVISNFRSIVGKKDLCHDVKLFIDTLKFTMFKKNILLSVSQAIKN